MAKLGYEPARQLKVKVASRNVAALRDPAVILVDQLKEIYIDSELDIIETANWWSFFLTAPWHAERSACTSNFVLRAPRYVMVEGRPAYKDKMHRSLADAAAIFCSRGPRYIASSSSRCPAVQDRPIRTSILPS